MEKTNAVERMRADWDARALENARFYINCQKWSQSDAEFDNSAPDVVARVRRDYCFMPPCMPGHRRFLEIGCGVGRLMRPLSEDCDEIHGIDVSSQMIEAGVRWLSGVRHARLHVATDSKLPEFPEAYFDLVYSFAVFQHIPDRDIVYSYLKDAFRVLKPGGIVAAHFNAAPSFENRCDTWIGVWIPEEELLSYAREQGWQVLSSEGARTQYLWMTLRKQRQSWIEERANLPSVEIVAVHSESETGEFVAGGPKGFATIYIQGLSDVHCDAAHLSVAIGDVAAHICYIGPERPDGLRQINIQIPERIRPQAASLSVGWERTPISNEWPVIVIQAPPLAPRLVTVTDGTQITSENVICSSGMQLTISGCRQIETLRVAIGDVQLPNNGTFCENPLYGQFKVNVLVPSSLTGKHLVNVAIDGQEIGTRIVEFMPRS